MNSKIALVLRSPNVDPSLSTDICNNYLQYIHRFLLYYHLKIIYKIFCLETKSYFFKVNFLSQFLI